MFFAGKPSDRARWLCDVNREALYEGIKQCGPDVPINAIGKVHPAQGVLEFTPKSTPCLPVQA